MLVFRSIVIPIKAIIMNLLSVGATYGLLVLVFQKGVGTDLLGFQHAEVIDAWIPLFLFSVLFGLSMDYHVFLLSRIRERYDQTGNNAEAVAYGLRSTAGLITGAALIMVAVFGGFAAGETIVNQQVGFGLAVAVLLDATLVRSVLVPASMEVLGRRKLVPAILAELASRFANRSGRGMRFALARSEDDTEAGAPMNIPTDYEAGYENARAIAPDVAAKYIAHTHIGDPLGEAMAEDLAEFSVRRVKATRRSGYE